MTKEDKQIIGRAIKENWQTGDRTRLKRLLEKNLELYRENVKLENENEMLRQGYIADKGEWVKRTDVLDKLEQAKEIIKLLLWDLRNKDYNPEKDIEKAEDFLGRNA